MRRSFAMCGAALLLTVLVAQLLAGGCPVPGGGAADTTDAADGTTGTGDATGDGSGTGEVEGVLELAATGQVTSYAAEDDGALRVGAALADAARFVDNGDGTISDLLSGLMWLKDASCLRTHYVDFDNDGFANEHVTWQRAFEFVQQINAGNMPACAGGHNDWRIPNVVEFESLISAEAADPSVWLGTLGFQNVLADDYWTSTTDPDTIETFAYVVVLSDGSVSRLGSKATGGPAITCVWPVRGTSTTLWKTGQSESYFAGDDGALEAGVAWPAPRFTDNGDGTVTDNLTGLMWLQDADALGLVTWQQALVAADTFNDDPARFDAENYTAAHTDWRVPNRKEYFSLAHFAYFEPALPPDQPFVSVSVNGTYWTSTTCAGDTERAWWADMRTGELGHDYKVNARRLMLVR